MFNIEKQEVGRDIYNIAGNLIINPITHEPVYLPTIQTVLRRGETTEGDFFKKEPEWVDYEQGFIVERKEVDEIIKKLETNKVQLVLGAPASGKSIILKNVGFKLTNEDKKVYVLELKKHPGDEIKLFFENIPKIDDDNPIFIVDDAHLYLSDCEKLIRNFKGRGKGKLIIGSRKTEKIKKGDPTVSSEFEHLSKTAITVKAEDVTEEMIKTFLEAEHHLNDERIKSASDSFDKFKNDLWHLSWALKAYKPEKDTVEENTIYEMIKERIKIIKAEDVFLPLSVFYRFEIPIERKFLEKQLGIKKEAIEPLIELSEIIETEEKGKPIMLSLNHSSLAELYFTAYQNYPSLGEEIREKILNQKDEKNLYFPFYLYITTTDPRNSVNIVISLHRDLFNKKGGITLLNNLIEEYIIQKSIEKGIEKEEDIEKVGSCLSDIAEASKEVGLKLAESLDINAFSSRINKEEDIGKVGLCVSYIAGASKVAGLKLAESLDINAFSSRINKEVDIIKVVSYVSYIARASKEVGLKLAESLDINAFSSRINKEVDIIKVGFCVSVIAQASEEVAMRLAISIEINTLSSKINKEVDIEKVGWCVSVIARASEEAALKLLESIEINALSSKINKEVDIKHVRSCVSGIARASIEVALKLVDSVSAKINKEDDIEKVVWCVSGIAQVSKEVANEILNRLNPEIKEELRQMMPYLNS